MSRRPRKHISLTERLAAALACLLPQDQRDDLRARKVTAKTVLALFEMDHIVLFALGGSDHWSNIDPKLRAPHREKSRRDTSIVAKVKRIKQRQVGGVRVTTYLVRPVAPKRKIQSRPWPPRGARKLQSRPFERVLK